MNYHTANGDQIEITSQIIGDITVGEVVQSIEGEMYEVRNIEDTNITVELIQVEEDWGE
ncbi:hypothetical protein KC717_00980 [Candidatus Dojkabacteria bacterium]|uniref:Uncharacterized protein n=1 Tax=Candidatus Dojkabacteria bacterium TaxID=2099670 RepID=A0A955L767_9BACT|nr:hypothetical protein [Candidatus Dojkabacteria bacterium]